MFLPPQIKTQALQEALNLSPFEKAHVTFFSDIYKSAKTFLDGTIFNKIRVKLEENQGTLNLRKKIDKAKLGHYIAIAELTHRQSLPSPFAPVSFGEDQNEQTTSEVEGEPNANPHADSEQTTSEQKDDPKERYNKMLAEYEAFIRLLLVGKIFPAPIETNGLENCPILKVFDKARTLDEVHRAYKKLIKLWHPDHSPFSDHESRSRFKWIKQAYQMLVDNWQKFDPQNPNIPASRVKKLMNQKLCWKPESFWY